MQYDELDLFILQKIMVEGEVTTHDIAKEFIWDDKKKFRNTIEMKRFFSAKDNKIMHRLKSMSKEGIVEIIKNNGKNNFVVIKERVKPCIMIRESDNKWIVLEI